MGVPVFVPGHPWQTALALTGEPDIGVVEAGNATTVGVLAHTPGANRQEGVIAQVARSVAIMPAVTANTPEGSERALGKGLHLDGRRLMEMRNIRMNAGPSRCVFARPSARVSDHAS
jgi:hypothetical protein